MSKLYWIINPKTGARYIASETEMQKVALKKKRARTHPVKDAVIEELKEGEYYSCSGCQDSVSYPHKCQGHLYYM